MNDSFNLEIHLPPSHRSTIMMGVSYGVKLIIFLASLSIGHILLQIGSSTHASLIEQWPAGTYMEKGCSNRSNNSNGVHTLNRTAIVYATKSLTKCKAIRLEHLLQTAPPEMDVWFLHNHKIVESDAVLKQSQHNLQFFEEEYGLKNLNQLPYPMRGNFDDKRSGPSKSSFVQFVKSHTEYDYVWLMEDDILITGSWKEFFERFDSNDADFISKRDLHEPDWYWYHSNCNIDVDYLPSKVTNFTRADDPNATRLNCHTFLNWAAMWPLIRVSRNGATHLVNDLLSGDIQGHHEAIVQAMILKYPNELKFEALPDSIGHNIHAGGWGPYADPSKLKLDIFQPLNMGAVYHPVKCDAYERSNEGLIELEKLMLAYGWNKKNETAIVRR